MRKALHVPLLLATMLALLGRARRLFRNSTNAFIGAIVLALVLGVLIMPVH